MPIRPVLDGFTTPLCKNSVHMLGGWVDPHKEQQTIPQGQTSSPPKFFFTPTAKARPDQAALATLTEARGATHRARPQREKFVLRQSFLRTPAPLGESTKPALVP